MVFLEIPNVPLGMVFAETVTYMISQLCLFPNGYGVVVLVGLIFATIICYICRFVTYVRITVT